jgi:hypothetical protein
VDRNYESAGAGDRIYYSYTADTLQHMLHLKNKNPRFVADSFQLRYSRPDSITIVLDGFTAAGDSLHTALRRTNKKYLFFEGRRQPIKL